MNAPLNTDYNRDPDIKALKRRGIHIMGLQSVCFVFWAPTCVLALLRITENTMETTIVFHIGVRVI